MIFIQELIENVSFDYHDLQYHENLIENVCFLILVQHQVLCLARLTLPHPCNLFMELVPHKPASPLQSFLMAKTIIAIAGY